MLINLKNKECNYIFERTDSLLRYYKSIQSYPLLTKSEEEKLFEIMNKSNDKSEINKAREKIINSNQRFVIAIAKFYGNNSNILDLINEGNIGLIYAVENFDYKRGFKFTSYAVWHIRRTINLYLSENSDIIQISKTKKLNAKIRKIIDTFNQKYNRCPNLDEIKDLLFDDYGIKINDAQDLQEIRMFSIDNQIDSQYSDDAYDTPYISEYNNLTSQNNNYVNILKNDIDKYLISKLLDNLNIKEKMVIEYSFGLNNKPQVDLGKISKMMNITRERARQIKDKALQKMNVKIKKYIEI